MRIIALTAIGIAMVYSITSSAQNQLGIEIGAQNYNVRYMLDHVYTQETSGYTNLKTGIFFRYNITDGFALIPSVNYGQIGFQLEEQNSSPSRMVLGVSGHSVGLSTLARISAKSGYMKPFFEIGPGLSYSVTQRMTVIGEGPSLEFPTHDFNRIDKNVTIGLGFATVLNNLSMDLFLRYKMGLDNLYTGADQGVILRSKALYFGTSISIFSIGKKKNTNCVERKCRR